MLFRSLPPVDNKDAEADDEEVVLEVAANPAFPGLKGVATLPIGEFFLPTEDPSTDVSATSELSRLDDVPAAQFDLAELRPGPTSHRDESSAPSDPIFSAEVPRKRGVAIIAAVAVGLVAVVGAGIFVSSALLRGEQQIAAPAASFTVPAQPAAPPANIASSEPSPTPPPAAIAEETTGDHTALPKAQAPPPRVQAKQTPEKSSVAKEKKKVTVDDLINDN